MPVTQDTPKITRSDFRKDISFYKQQTSRLEKRLLKEQTKYEDNLEKIQSYINKNKNLDIEQLVEMVIVKGWVTKDKLTKQQLYSCTKDLILDFIEADI